jgi:MFS family permease
MSSSIKGETAPQAVATTAPPPARLTIAQQLALSSFWFATNLHWGALLLIIIPRQCKLISPGDSAGAIAWVFGIGALCALIIPLIAGALSDRSTSRYGRRRPFMVVGIAVNLVGLAIMGVAVARLNLVLYILGYLVVQFGNNTAGAAYAGVIPDMVPPAQHGEASGYMATMTQAGMILGAFIGGKFMEKGQSTEAYLIIACILIVFVVLTVVTMHEKPLETKPAPITPAAFIHSLLEPLRYPDFFWVLVTRALVTLGMWCVQPFIQNYLSDVLHVKNDAEMGSYLLVVILACATITGLLGGKISDVIGRKKVVYVANTLIAICSIAFVFSHSLLYTFIVGALYGIGYGAYFSVDWALACDVLPNMDDAGKDMGIWHISMVLPQTFAPALAGFVLGHVGTSTLVEGTRHYALQGYQAAFTLGAVFLMLGAFFLRNVRERRDREKIAAAA